jgi:primase-polymerase (primpol)-like protein
MRRFLLWRYEQVKERLTKVPYCSATRKAAANKPDTWNTFSGALDIYMTHPGFFSGLGIVLGDGITGIDLDHVIDAEGCLDPKAAEIVTALPGYVERSPSGEGLHILLKGSLPVPGERGGLKFGNIFGFKPISDDPRKSPGIEFYDETSPRYLTVTGDVWENRCGLNTEDASPAIASVYWQAQKAHEGLKAAKETAKIAGREAQKGKKAEEPPAKKPRKDDCPFDYNDDGSLIEYIRKSKQGAKFSRLFDCGWDGYPSPSEARMALLNILAWWTQKDEARMARLFQRSALFNLDPAKWKRPQNGETLGSIEIRKACDTCRGEYDPQRSRSGQAERLTVSGDINEKLPTIIARDRQLTPLLREIADSLQTDKKLFRHGGGLISVENGTIIHYTAEAMPALLSRWANYLDGNNRGVFPPATASKAILYSVNSDDGIRPLERVINIPTLRADGTLLDTPGYDPESKLFYHPTTDIPPIPEHPEQQDAEIAAAWLLDMLCDFPFDSESSRYNYLGLLLTFVVRPLCRCVPLALVDAPMMGTGKSLLAKIACITATGEGAAFGVQLGDEAETRKNITSRLRDGPSIIVLDNIVGTISSPTLAACLTAETWEDRLLGHSRMLSLPMRAAVIATGNNLRVGKDMPRRCFYIRLDANEVQPWRREGFKYNLPEYAIQNRGRIVAALLTMARAWLCARRPQGDNLPSLGSFEEWCNIVGGILQFAGLNGFLGNIEEMRRSTADEEDDAGAWEAWMAAIHDWVTRTYIQPGDEVFTVSRLAGAMNNISWKDLKDDAPDSLGEIGEPGDRAWLTRLGKSLGAHAGQVFDLDGEIVKLIRKVDKHKRKKIYQLISIGNEKKD